MALFKRGNEKEQLLDEINQMSEEEFENFEKNDYAKREKRAHRVLVGATIACVALLAMLGITALFWGVAAYAIGFAATAVAGAGAITIGSSWLARRHFRKYRKMKEAYAEAQSGKTKKGRVLSPEKQAASSHQASKNAEYLAKRGKISERVYNKYVEGDKSASAQASKGRRGRHSTSEEVSTALKTNRAQMKFRMDQSRDSFIKNDLGKYQVSPDKTGKVEVLVQKYNENTGFEHNSEGNPVFEPMVTYDCTSDIDLLATQKCVVNSLAIGNSEYPVCMRVTVGGVPKVFRFMNQDNVNSYKSESDARIDQYLAEHLDPSRRQESSSEIELNSENESPTLSL